MLIASVVLLSRLVQRINALTAAVGDSAKTSISCGAMRGLLGSTQAEQCHLFQYRHMTTTGYGDISPKSRWARFLVSIQILFGFFYNVLFFSIFAGLAGTQETRLIQSNEFDGRDFD
jgi:hypothetical protein